MTQQLGSQPSRRPAPPPPRMSCKQFLEWDFENPHVEWVDGEVLKAWGTLQPAAYAAAGVAGVVVVMLAAGR